MIYLAPKIKLYTYLYLTSRNLQRIFAVKCCLAKKVPVSKRINELQNIDVKKKYVLKSPITVGHLARVIAKLIDLFIVLLLSVLFYPVSILAGVAYISFADHTQHGQSVGKKFIGMAVVSLEDGNPCSWKQSVVRNLPISIPVLFAIIPFWGWLFTLFIGVPLVLFEIYLMFRLDSGHRLGDVMADTTVMAKDQGEEITKKSKSSWFENKASVR